MTFITILRRQEIFMKNKNKIKILLDLRPALEGFAGIPQETRMLFSILRKMENIQTSGMIQTSWTPLFYSDIKEKDLSSPSKHSKIIDKMSRTIVSFYEAVELGKIERLRVALRKRMIKYKILFNLPFNASKIKFFKFNGSYFDNFIWVNFFSKSLPSSMYDLVTKGMFFVNPIPWQVMHSVGFFTKGLFKTPLYPKLKTTDFDIFISQVPYPGSPTKPTLHLVRYHDAIPITHPHFIPDKKRHQATHFNALLYNIKKGAYFACVSEFTRNQLISIFPEVEQRTFVIHNTVSPFYFYERESDKSRVPDIILARPNHHSADVCLPKFFTNREKENFYQKHLFSKPFDYLLVVCTIEPRKNHLRLFSAWETLRAKGYDNLKLVVVGDLGWDNDLIMKKARSWIDRGEMFFLNKVPASDLRVLYKYASATVCPSFVEGFDFSGVESMRCGGVVVASDIPVHKEIYQDACIYFNPHSTESTAKAIQQVITNKQLRDSLIAKGFAVSEKYTYEAVMPQWAEAIEKLISIKTKNA